MLEALGGFAVVLWIVGAIAAILWFFMPFIIMGMSSDLRAAVKELRELNIEIVAIKQQLIAVRKNQTDKESP